MNPRNWTRMIVLALAAAAAGPAAHAVDPWEGGAFPGDDISASRNSLSHGLVQQHDLDRDGGPVDVDWMAIPTLAGHSYEVRLAGANANFDNGECPECAQFQRVAWDEAVLQEDAAVVNDGTVAESYDRTIRWIATSDQANLEYIRVRGNTTFFDGADSVYTVRFWDTTYGIPRWNAANGQTTVFLIQNLTQGTVSGSMRLFTVGGTLAHQEPFSLNRNMMLVFNASSIPGLVGQSGHAYVVHTAGYGGLSGKAVALEPATGFSFDSPMQPIPH
jgi:hypothetical protein